jgi:hypothetical protein
MNGVSLKMMVSKKQNTNSNDSEKVELAPYVICLKLL